MTQNADPADAELLAELFDQFLDHARAGSVPDLATQLARHPALAADIERTWHLANQLAGNTDGAYPDVPGFTILNELGRGGMGVVYLARQQAVDRIVALKVLPGSALGGGHARERFAREVRAIGGLHHPGIVTVHASGEAKGIAYYAMEYVDGRSLAQALANLRQRKVPAAALTAKDLDEACGMASAAHPAGDSYVAAATRLVASVAEAQAHAHAQGVVHRDVKPANILVRRDGRPMLCDFGLARVPADASLTLSSDFVGTVLYAAPEQLSGRTEGGGPELDVYSLGCTLHELLTLRLPHAGVTASELLHSMSRSGTPSPRRANPRVPRDLDTVCQMALEFDPRRRYPDAAAFAADLQRFLALEPITARPVSGLTRAVRWTQRNRLLTVTLVCAVLLVVVAPLALWLVQRQANVAIERQMKRAQAINEFQRDLFGYIDPQAGGADAKVVDLVDFGARKLEHAYANDPELRAEMHELIGGQYHELGRHAQAEEQFRLAIAAWETLPEPPQTQILQDQNWLAVCGYEQGNLDAAITELQRIGQDATARFGPDDSVVLTAKYQLSHALQLARRLPECLEVAQQVVAGRTRVLGATDRDTLAARNLEAMALTNLMRLGEARAVFVPLLRDYEARFGTDHSEVLKIRNNFAAVLFHEGDYLEACRVYEGILPIRQHLLGPAHWMTLQTQTSIAECLRSAKELDRAMAVMDEAFPVIEASLPETNWLRIDTLYKRGRLLLDRGDFAEAESVLRRCHDYADRCQPPDVEMLLRPLLMIASAQEQKQQLEAALATKEECMRIAGEQLSPGNWMTWAVQAGHASVLRKLHRDQDAETEFLEAWSKLRELQVSERASDPLFIARELAALYAHMGLPEKEAEWRQRADTGKQSK